MTNPTEGKGDPTQRTIETVHREVRTVQERADLLLAGVKEITTERFRSIERQLALVESQRTEQKSDTALAVGAALTAQKEAVKEQTTASERAIAKSEMAMTKQLEQLNATFSTAIEGVKELLSATKDRVGTLEGLKQGSKDGMAMVLAAASVFISLAGLALLVART